MSPRTIGTVAALTVTAAAINLGAFLVVLVVSRWVLASGPVEHQNPSFQYGERVLDEDVYNVPLPGSVADACRRAIDRRTDHPRSFDETEAVHGCQYLEYVYDN